MSGKGGEEWVGGSGGRTRLAFVRRSEYVVACTSDSHYGFFYALDVVGSSAESARSSWCVLLLGRVRVRVCPFVRAAGWRL